MEKNTDYFMNRALIEAEKAYSKGEAPIGAIIVKDDKIISRAYNLRESKQSATAHAEILAIDKACKKLGSWRLNGTDLYVTLEPCPMCAGAIIQSRISRVFFGAFDPKAGAVGSKLNLFSDMRFNHKVEFYGGIMQDECSELLSNFFRDLRKK